MEKKFTILIALMFILSVLAPFVFSASGDGDVQTYEEIISSPSPPFDYAYLYQGDDFGWTHTFDSTNYILSAEIEIRAFDIDSGDPHYQEDKVYADGDYLGYLEGSDMDWSITTFTINPAILADGIINMWLDIDSTPIGSKMMIDYSKLIVEYQPHVIVEKWNHGEEYVPVNTAVEFPMEIYVKNPDTEADDDLTDVVVLDGIGAEFDLVIQDPDTIPDNGDEYIFMIDDNPILIDDGDEYNGHSGAIYWWQANNGKGANKNKGCATKILWTIGTLAEDSARSLEFTIVTKSWTAGNSDNTKQSFTSTCWHYLNDGAYVYYDIGDDSYWVQSDNVRVSVYDPDPTADSDGDGWYDILEVDIYLTDPCDDEDYPESFQLVEKVPSGEWPTVEDGAHGTLTYTPIWPTFDFEFEGEGLAGTTAYSLIYYADPWPGNNPGALIGTGISDGLGDISIIGDVELNMDLPDSADANYPTGAKIWLVPSSDYNEATNSMTGWNPTTYLFEQDMTDRVFYDDTDL